MTPIIITGISQPVRWPGVHLGAATTKSPPTSPERA